MQSPGHCFLSLLTFPSLVAVVKRGSVYNSAFTRNYPDTNDPLIADYWVIERSTLFDPRRFENRTFDLVRSSTVRKSNVRSCSIHKIFVWVRSCSILEQDRPIRVRSCSIPERSSRYAGSDAICLIKKLKKKKAWMGFKPMILQYQCNCNKTSKPTPRRWNHLWIQRETIFAQTVQSKDRLKMNTYRRKLKKRRSLLLCNYIKHFNCNWTKTYAAITTFSRVTLLVSVMSSNSYLNTEKVW